MSVSDFTFQIELLNTYKSTNQNSRTLEVLYDLFNTAFVLGKQLKLNNKVTKKIKGKILPFLLNQLLSN